MYDLGEYVAYRLSRGHFRHLALSPPSASFLWPNENDVRVTQCAITLFPIHFREFDGVSPRGGGHPQGGGGVSRLSRDASAANRSNGTPKAMVAVNLHYEFTDG